MKENLWKGLRYVAANTKKPQLIVKDFNACLDGIEKNEGINNVTTSYKKFQKCIKDYRLIDLGFSKPKHTWVREGVKERLDKALCKAAWRVRFEDEFVNHLLE